MKGPYFVVASPRGELLRMGWKVGPSRGETRDPVAIWVPRAQASFEIGNRNSVCVYSVEYNAMMAAEEVGGGAVVERVERRS